jgi:formylmethanofuran dehydrogenase subunit E
MMDNYDLWERHNNRQEQDLAQSIHCEYCGKPIQDDYCYEINGDILCEKCLNDNFRRSTDNY